jgi:hypothetical protein
MIQVRNRKRNQPVTMNVYDGFFPAADIEAATHIGRVLTGGK